MIGRLIRPLLPALVGIALLAPTASADLHPGTPERVDGQSVYDDGGLLGPAGETVENIADTMAEVHGVSVVVVTRTLDEERAVNTDQAKSIASVVASDWDLSRAVVMAVVANPDHCRGGAAIVTVDPLPGATLNAKRIVAQTMLPALKDCDPATATLNGLVEVVSGLSGVKAARGSDAPGAPGPPFPDPQFGRAVYDNAVVFSAETISSAESTIDAIEARTGAEVVVYSQVVDYGITTEEADRHAQALIDQWGVGRKGFDDGLVILFDLDPSLVHGQVQLYGGPGYRAAYLDNAEKQQIFDEDMLPLLKAGNLDGALLVALERVDANATPEHAAQLQRARQLDAALGLIGAPIILFGLIGSALFAWLRYGRDPVYLDDPSIHMAGPPPDLTPAAATFVLAGGPSRRALTTAMLDLASRGFIAFREEKAMLGLNRKVGIQFDPPAGDITVEAQRARNAARPLGPAEEVALARLRTLARGDEGYIDPQELLKFGSSVDDFDKALETHAVKMGWFAEKPSKAEGRWTVRGAIALVAGVIALVVAFNLPSQGLTLIGGALLIAGVVVLVMSRWMDAVTMSGAMIRAMLAAYRRTLQKTMAVSRSMDQVVAKAGFDWLETPDQAVLWGTALGLEKEVEDVLERSLADVKDGRATPASVYLPAWYGIAGAGGSSGGGPGGGGLFSSSAVPNLGGMMAALGTIGNSPSSSGGGGGGFGGGGSGGGGGGSGGGF